MQFSFFVHIDIYNKYLCVVVFKEKDIKEKVYIIYILKRKEEKERRTEL